MKKADLITILHNCVAHCESCAGSCLQEDNLEMMRTCIKTDIVCASICKATATILATDFKDVNELIAHCAKVCNQCAQECEKHDHEHCKACAVACRKCAEACNAYLK
ncbi:MAG: four-helix bundle copper-binding protein [Flavobacteriales bacterium]|jgi:hypothetical protein|nr:four-helix bundle copper-binding protein [Flavobacteriales bacterium]